LANRPFSCCQERDQVLLNNFLTTTLWGAFLLHFKGVLHSVLHVILLKTHPFLLPPSMQKEEHCTAQLDHLPSLCLALAESSTQANKAERGAAGPVKLCSVLPFALLKEGRI
jgi:hypothetical protein